MATAANINQNKPNTTPKHTFEHIYSHMSGVTHSDSQKSVCKLIDSGARMDGDWLGDIRSYVLLHTLRLWWALGKMWRGSGKSYYTSECERTTIKKNTKSKKRFDEREREKKKWWHLFHYKFCIGQCRARFLNDDFDNGLRTSCCVYSLFGLLPRSYLYTWIMDVACGITLPLSYTVCNKWTSIICTHLFIYLFIYTQRASEDNRVKKKKKKQKKIEAMTVPSMWHSVHSRPSNISHI